MSRDYYILRYLLDHRIGYLVWFSGEGDGVVTDPDGKVPAFRDERELVAFARAEGLVLSDEGASSVHNLDVVRLWLKRKRPGRVDCVALLAAWNLFSDVSASVGGSFDADKKQTRTIYDKLFWGNNLPSVTPAGRCYEPLWSGREVRVMREMVGKGLTMFRERVRVQG